MEPKRLTDDELAAIRARAEAATPGPWYTIGQPWAHSSCADTFVKAGNPDPHISVFVCDCQSMTEPEDEYKPGDYRPHENAEFIAVARADIPALLAHADALAADRDALAAENARLRGERRVMHDVLLTLVSHIHMRAHPSNRTKWVCPYCKGTHKSLTALEEGEGHTENCPYAAARALLKGGE